ncbi:MAG TPA: Stp1/IreP family PP2C-type Ser/Thr phosphatase [Gaiellaceae bacterium]|nr:Stp1/IreP family PP2C-type Ser/Thr phosphatase [Gaiellaceae bacterium]
MIYLGRSTGLSDPGRKRRRNEDAWVLQPPLFAVADGMGGARGGEIASRVAATALGEAVDGSGEERVVALIKKANRQVFERARDDADATGMGTTITVALVEDGVVAIGHVGDSRAYLIRDQKVEQLTEDHSLVAELVRSGRLSPEEAEIHPQRSVITRVLGVDPDVDVDSFTVEASAGDVFLICSDGLTSMIDDETILGIVEPRRDDLNSAAKELIGAANRSGGEDNITVVCFEMTDTPPEPPAETKAMPVVQAPAPPAAEPDEDTLSGLEGVPTVQTTVISPEQAQAQATADGTEPEQHEQPKERFGMRAARLVIALAVVAALGLLVYWLFGQSR